jgi:hypothetical protein
MPDAIAGALVAASGIIFVGMLGAIVKLTINGRRANGSTTALRCPASGAVAAARQEMETFHPQLARSLDQLAAAQADQSKHLVKIATILDERMPKRGSQ